MSKRYVCCGVAGAFEFQDGDEAFAWFAARYKTETAWVEVVEGSHRYEWLSSMDAATVEFMNDYLPKGT